MENDNHAEPLYIHEKFRKIVPNFEGPDLRVRGTIVGVRGWGLWGVHKMGIV